MPATTNRRRRRYLWLVTLALFSLTALFPAIAAKKAKTVKIKPTVTPIEIADEALWKMNYPVHFP